MKKSTIWISLLVLGLILAGFLWQHGSDPVPVPVPYQAETETATESEVTEFEPVYLHGENGEFEIQFPGYCSRIVTRANEPDLFGGETWDDIVQIQYSFCDHPEFQGEGCSFHAIYNLRGKDGTMAGPENVVLGVEDLMKKYGVRLVDQMRIKKDFGKGVIAEGIDVRGRSATGPGQFLIRGLLIDGDIYFMAAWNERGGVWENPEYLAFFNSFKPLTE